MLFTNSQSIERESQRKFQRVEYTGPITFKSYSPVSEQFNYQEDFSAEGASKNICPGGICFKSDRRPPKSSSVLWMNLDVKTVKALTLCLEAGQRPLAFENGLLGKIAHIEEDPESKAFSIGVSFVTKFDAALP